MRVLLFLLFPIFLSAQINRAYGVIEIGATFPVSSSTGPKFAYRTVDSSFYRWVSGSTWIKIIPDEFMPLDSLVFNPTTADPDTAELKYNADLETFWFGADGTTIEIGQKEAWYVKNQTGSTINKGTVVRAAGTLGSSGRILISPMAIDGTVDSKYLLGIAASNIANGSDGYVIHFGKLRKFNTSAWSDGAVLYAGASGTLTATEPSPPNLRLPIAFVVHSHATNGILAIRIQTGNELHELHDVDTTGITDSGTLVWDEALSKWKAAPPDYDRDSTNEIQTLFFDSVTGDLDISGGNTVSLLGILNGYTSGTGTAGRIPYWNTSTSFANSPIAYNSTTKRTTWDSPGILELPMGTDAQRPTATTSDFWYNTTGNGIEWYNGTRWAKSPEFTFNRGTQGRLPFPDANGQYTESSNLAWDNTNLGLTLISNATGAGRGLIIRQTNNAISSAVMQFEKIRGSGAVSNGDLIGLFSFRGYSGTQYVTDNALFGGFITGTVTSSSVPTSIFFNAGSTTGSYTTQLLVHSGGNVGVGNFGSILSGASITAPSEKFHVIGNILATGTLRTLSTTTGNINNITFKNTYNSGAKYAINWTDVTDANVTQIYTTFDGTKVDLRIGSLYNSAYNSTDRFHFGGNGRFGIGTTSPNYILDATSTNAYGLPRGTVAQRPTIASSTTPIRFNTDSTALEYGESVGTWRQLATRAYARSLVNTISTANFANTNLTATGNRTHDWANYNFTWTNMKKFMWGADSLFKITKEFSGYTYSVLRNPSGQTLLDLQGDDDFASNSAEIRLTDTETGNIVFIAHDDRGFGSDGFRMEHYNGSNYHNMLYVNKTSRLFHINQGGYSAGVYAEADASVLSGLGRNIIRGGVGTFNTDTIAATYYIRTKNNLTKNRDMFGVYTQNGIIDTMYFRLDKVGRMFQYKDAFLTQNVSFSAYGTGTKEAADLSKTESAYAAIYATDGTLLEKSLSSLADGNGIYTGSGTLASHTTRAAIQSTGNLLFTQKYNSNADSAWIQVVNGLDGNREVRLGLTDTASTGRATLVLKQDADNEVMAWDLRSSDGSGATQLTGDGGNISATVDEGFEIQLSGMVRAKREAYAEITSTSSPQTLSSTYSDNLINQGGTQATFTLNMPASPEDGQVCYITFNNAISTLTIDGNGETIVGSAVVTGVQGSQRKFKFYTGIGWIKLY